MHFQRFRRFQNSKHPESYDSAAEAKTIFRGKHVHEQANQIRTALKQTTCLTYVVFLAPSLGEQRVF